MKQQHSNLLKMLVAGLPLISLLCLTSCDDGKYDHTPPTGKGSLIVDNSTDSDAEVYIDGIYMGEADSGEATAFDLDPGVYRLVLAEKNGDRNYWNDIDVILDRLTILDVMTDYSSASLYYVVIDFERP